MLFRAILYGLLIYLVYKFIFDLIIPVYKTTQKIKKGFSDMHNQMNQQQSSPQSPTKESVPKEKTGDYIDFEELK
jgi:hypothetical protein